jgi:hypothetical protein
MRTPSWMACARAPAGRPSRDRRVPGEMSRTPFVRSSPVFDVAHGCVVRGEAGSGVREPASGRGWGGQGVVAVVRVSRIGVVVGLGNGGAGAGRVDEALAGDAGGDERGDRQPVDAAGVCLSWLGGSSDGVLGEQRVGAAGESEVAADVPGVPDWSCRPCGGARGPLFERPANRDPRLPRAHDPSLHPAARKARRRLPTLTPILAQQIRPQFCPFIDDGD